MFNTNDNYAAVNLDDLFSKDEPRDQSIFYFDVEEGKQKIFSNKLPLRMKQKVLEWLRDDLLGEDFFRLGINGIGDIDECTEITSLEE
jgi:hypothetical protein